MSLEEGLPKRKHPRLDKYDYSLAGAYFVTICTQNRKCVFSRIVGGGLDSTVAKNIEYTTFGKIAEKQLLELEKRYSHLFIEQYVIMPNHIHVIMVLTSDTSGVNPRPTLIDIICAYKSLTTKECKKQGFFGKLFQTSFYDHIIRGREDYDEITEYIYKNPIHWYFDELYSEDGS